MNFFLKSIRQIFVFNNTIILNIIYINKYI
jgi:hypothetical protein